jgi:glutathione S-transferase kappa 1
VQVIHTFRLSVRRDCDYSSEEAQALLAASSSPSVKDTLRRTTEEAIRLGAFGVPFMSLEGDSVPDDCRCWFGSDRLEQIAAVLQKPWHGPAYGAMGSTSERAKL